MLHTFMIGHDLSIFGSNSTPSQKNMFVVLPVPFMVSQAPGLFFILVAAIRSLSNRGWVCLDIRSSAMSQACLNGHTMPEARDLRRPPDPRDASAYTEQGSRTLIVSPLSWRNIIYIYMHIIYCVYIIIFMIIYACYMYEYIYIYY